MKNLQNKKIDVKSTKKPAPQPRAGKALTAEDLKKVAGARMPSIIR